MRRAHFAMMCVVVLTVAYGAQAQHYEHDEHRAATQPATTKSVLSTPEAMQIEHRHLHAELVRALAAGGKTAVAAKQVETALAPHFIEEEAYAMPPLSLLPKLARHEQLTEEQIRTAIAMTDKLRANYDQMLKEHQAITKALGQLVEAAQAEDKPQQAAFAEGLMLHAQNEEQILYPAALVVGEYLKAKSPAARD